MNPYSEGIEIKKTIRKSSSIIFILLLFIVSQVFSSISIADDTEYPFEEMDDLPDGLIPFNPFNGDGTLLFIKYFLQHPAEVLSYSLSNPAIAAGYYSAFLRTVFSSNAWEFASDTVYVEIGYGETVYVHIGKVNMEVFNETIFRNLSLQPFMKDINFQFIRDKYPGGHNGSWLIDFDPDVLIIDEIRPKALYDVNMSITLTSPPVGDKAIQSGILRIRQKPTQHYGNFMDMGGYLGFLYTILFGKDVAGTTSTPKYENMRKIDIIVKVKPYHKVSIDVPPVVKLNPNQVTAIPINVQNLGNYKDTIGFRINGTNDKITVADPIDITLIPGDSKETLLAVGVPPSIFEIGTFHKVKIEAYSTADPNITIAEQTITIETEGFYLSEYGMFIMGAIIFLIVIIYLYINSKKKKHITHYITKPEKPWEIPEEKEFLNKIKKKDKKKYNETLEMMVNEYNSAMLWYKHYRQSIENKEKQKQVEIRQKENEERKKLKDKKTIKKKDETKPVAIAKTKKKKDKETEDEKKEIKPEPKPIFKPPKEQRKDKDQIKKEKAIEKIKRVQEKQRRKMGGIE